LEKQKRVPISPMNKRKDRCPLRAAWESVRTSCAPGLRAVAQKILTGETHRRLPGSDGGKADGGTKKEEAYAVEELETEENESPKKKIRPRSDLWGHLGVRK